MKEQGLINSESISQVLRSVSQQRKQGVLRLHAEGQNLQLVFFEGKVIDAFGARMTSGAQSLYEKFVVAGIVPGLQPDVSVSDYRGLEGELKRESGAFSLQDYIEQHVIDTLCTLNVSKNCSHAFKVERVEYYPELHPAISIGQLLLDLVGFDSDRSRFEELFEGVSSISSLSEHGLVFSEYEARVYNLLVEGLPLQELKEKALLSQSHLQEALLTLYDGGALSLEKPGAQNPAEGGAGSDLLGEDVLSGLDSSFDSIFAEDGLAVESGTGQQHARPLVDQGVSVDNIGLEHAQLPALDWKTRLSVLNAKLLAAHWIPHLLAAVFFTVALLSPWLLWSEVVGRFFVE